MILSLLLSQVAFVARRHRRSGSAITVAAILCTAPVPAAAVGLGAITQQSALGRSLRIVVPLALGPGEDVPAECFKLAPGQGGSDGVPDLVFGRVSVERTSSGTHLVITSPRPVNEPVVRLTIQAGCETTVRREYTLFMDPPAIEAPVVAAAEPSARDVLGLPPPEPAPRESRRPPPRSPARASARSGQASGSTADVETSGKTTPPKGRVAPKTAGRPPPASAAARPRLSVSSGAPGTLQGSVATEADRERARQERANAIEAETQVLRQRIVELTAMVERMQAELRAQELSEQAAAAQAAKATADAGKAPETGTSPATLAEAARPPQAAPPAEAAKPPAAPPAVGQPAPVESWWEANAPLIAAIVGLPFVIAAGLLWKRRRDAAQDDQWRTHAISTRTDTLSRPSSQLRNPAAGLVMSDRRTAAPTIREIESAIPARDAVDALAVSELSHVTEEAQVFMALGHNDRAIEVLQDHIRRLPRSMPAAWLMLLDLCHAVGDRSEFRKVAEQFHVHFNARTPLWDEFAGQSPVPAGIEGFPHVAQQVVALWRQPGCRAYLEGLLYGNREGRRNGFPLSTYADILLLLEVLDAPADVDIDEDLVAAGKLEGRPQAKTATTHSVKRPMPPDPTSSRPAQQPIRFEIEPQDSGDKKRS